MKTAQITRCLALSALTTGLFSFAPVQVNPPALSLEKIPLFPTTLTPVSRVWEGDSIPCR